MVFSVEPFLVSAVLKSLETTFNICLDIVGEIGGQVLRTISVPLKLLATLMGLVESSRTWSSLSFFLIDRIEIQSGVDKTRNMEHSGTSRNIPEHEKIKKFLIDRKQFLQKFIITK